MQSLIEYPKAGDFAAKCMGPCWATFEEVLEAGQETTHRNPKTGLFAMRCSLVTDDREVFIEHMRTVHGAKAPATLRKLTPWKAPKLTEEGKAHEPSGLEVGATVKIETMRMDGVVHEGQVWSQAPDGGVWVATGSAFYWVHKSGGYGAPHSANLTYNFKHARLAA